MHIASGGTIGLPLEMGWDVSRLFADEENVVRSPKLKSDVLPRAHEGVSIYTKARFHI